METITVDLNDDFFKKLNTKESYQVNDEHLDDFWKMLREEVSTEFIQQFGIQDLLDRLNLGNLSQYKRGGDVSTVHNAHNDVFVDDDHRQRFNKAYNHKDYEGRIITDKNGKKVGDNRLSAQRKKIFQENEVVRDAYTHKTVEKNSSMNLDHITSAKNIHDNDWARLFMTDDERNDMAVSPKNMAPVDERVNKSKQELNATEWMDKTKYGQSNEERYGVDRGETEELQHISEAHIKGNVRTAAAREFGKAASAEGLQQAKRQVYGVFLYEISDIVMDELKKFVGDWSKYPKISDKIDGIQITFKKINQRVFDRLTHVKELLGEALSATATGFTSGVLGVLMDTILNIFKTTTAAWGKILQAGLTSFIQAVKLYTTNPQGLSSKELFKSVEKLLVVGINTAIGLVASEKINDALKPIVPPILNEVIATSVGVLISSCLSAFVLYSINNLGNIIKVLSHSFDEMLDDFRVNAQVSTDDIKTAYQSAMNDIDDAYSGILESIFEQYEETNRLAFLAHDLTQLASAQLFASVNYARNSGVPESEILHNNDETTKYFLG